MIVLQCVYVMYHKLKCTCIPLPYTVSHDILSHGICPISHDICPMSHDTYRLKTSLHAGGTHLAVLARGVSSYLSVALDVRDVDSIAGMVHAHVAQSLLTLLG